MISFRNTFFPLVFNAALMMHPLHAEAATEVLKFEASLHRGISTTESVFVGKALGEVTFDLAQTPTHVVDQGIGRGSSRIELGQLQFTFDGKMYSIGLGGRGWVSFFSDQSICPASGPTLPCYYPDTVVIFAETFSTPRTGTYSDFLTLNLALVGSDAMLASGLPPTDTSFVQHKSTAFLWLNTYGWYPSITVGATSVSVSAVPELSTVAMLLSGLALLVLSGLHPHQPQPPRSAA